VFGDERYDSVEDNPAYFFSAYRQMLKRLETNYPDAEIWCCTLPISRCSAKASFTFPYYYAGRNISEYCDAIRICAREFNCREIDLYNKADPHDTLDGFHPTADGMRTIANAIISELSEK
jgi:lysophospholipase L1-like esterase